MVYVMSDIHGRLNYFEAMLKQIKLQPEDTLYILGDVIDRGPDGIKILRKIISMPNVKMLLGNHEHMMLNTLNVPYDLKNWNENLNYSFARSLWYGNGGDVTHKQFKHMRKDTRKEIINYLANLPINIDIEINGIKYKLVHAAPLDFYKEYDYKYDDEVEYAVWCRWSVFTMNELLKDTDYILIFGHTPVVKFNEKNPIEIFIKNRIIGIDCGCAYPEDYEIKGRLGCLRLDDMKEFYIRKENV